MTNWTHKRERGSVWLIIVITWLAPRIGRSLCRALLYPIVFYFILTDKVARLASKEFLQEVSGQRVYWNLVFMHIYYFATTLLDRIFMTESDFKKFDITITGLPLVISALKEGRGCLLLGSHLGSFDLLIRARHALGERRVNVMMRVDPHTNLRKVIGVNNSLVNIIPLGHPNSYLHAYEAINKGEIVAVLADRVDGSSKLPVQFMNRLTAMPTAPHILAARCRAPILMFFGIYENSNKYRIEFVECGTAASVSSHGVELQSEVNLYTRILETYARRYPLNWFNFYPYWSMKDQEL